MITLKVNGVDIGAQYGVYLQSKAIGIPTTQTQKVEIPGRNGVIDLAKYLHNTTYGNRTISLVLYVPDRFGFEDSKRAILALMHGQEITIAFSDDPNYYYTGVGNVKSYETTQAVATLEIDIDAQPYKLKTVETVESYAVAGSQTVILANEDRKTVIPTITTDAAFTLEYNGYTAAVESGTTTLATLQLTEGNTTVIISGTGSVTFTYRKGAL